MSKALLAFSLAILLSAPGAIAQQFLEKVKQGIEGANPGE